MDSPNIAELPVSKKQKKYHALSKMFDVVGEDVLEIILQFCCLPGSYRAMVMSSCSKLFRRTMRKITKKQAEKFRDRSIRIEMCAGLKRWMKMLWSMAYEMQYKAEKEKEETPKQRRETEASKEKQEKELFKMVRNVVRLELTSEAFKDSFLGYLKEDAKMFGDPEDDDDAKHCERFINFTAPLMYSQDMRSHIREFNPSLTIVEVSKLCLKRWEEESFKIKKEYREKARQRYTTISNQEEETDDEEPPASGLEIFDDVRLSYEERAERLGWKIQKSLFTLPRVFHMWMNNPHCHGCSSEKSEQKGEENSVYFYCETKTDCYDWTLSKVISGWCFDSAPEYASQMGTFLCGKCYTETRMHRCCADETLNPCTNEQDIFTAILEHAKDVLPFEETDKDGSSDEE